MITVLQVDPFCTESRELLDRLSDTLAQLTGSSGRASFDPAEMTVPGSLFAVARDDTGKAVGCGAYRPLQTGVAEIKRMYALPDTAGVGSAVLAYLEDQARRAGYAEAWLETRQVNERAMRFYQARGYRRIANFGRYAERSEAACFGKMLIVAGCEGSGDRMARGQSE
jgi:GNAT superfamily N-acetyltransferase